MGTENERRNCSNEGPNDKTIYIFVILYFSISIQRANIHSSLQWLRNT